MDLAGSPFLFILFFLLEIDSSIEMEVSEAVVHVDMAVTVVERMETERHSEEPLVVVIDKSHTCDEVDVELVETEMSELGVLFLVRPVCNFVGVVKCDIIGKSRRERYAKKPVFCEHPVVCIAEIE